MNKTSQSHKLVNTLKTANLLLVVVLLVISTGCTSAAIKSNAAKNSKIAVLTSPSGGVYEVVSTDEDISDKSVRLPRVSFNRSKILCKTQTNENYALKQHEVDLELSFMINSLNSQTPYRTEKGQLFRKLSSNMVRNLKHVPDCNPYRYKLHVISKLVSGSSLESMDD